MYFHPFNRYVSTLDWCYQHITFLKRHRDGRGWHSCVPRSFFTKSGSGIGGNSTDSMPDAPDSIPAFTTIFHQIKKWRNQLRNCNSPGNLCWAPSELPWQGIPNKLICKAEFNMNKLELLKSMSHYLPMWVRDCLIFLHLSQSSWFALIQHVFDQIRS